MIIDRLTEIDETTRGDHYHLAEEDVCYYLGEYTARQGFGYSEMNRLIINLKHKPEHRNTRRWYWKERAISQFGAALRQNINRKGVEHQETLVPIPPSKAKGDPQYDDRMLRILRSAFGQYRADIRELVLQKGSMPADHESGERVSYDKLLASYYIDENASQPEPTSILLFDDVLTTGKHFRVAKQRLIERFPNIDVIGVFIARCVRDSDFDVFRNPLPDPDNL